MKTPNSRNRSRGAEVAVEVLLIANSCTFIVLSASRAVPALRVLFFALILVHAFLVIRRNWKTGRLRMTFGELRNLPPYRGSPPFELAADVASLVAIGVLAFN